MNEGIRGTAALIKNDDGEYLLHLRDDIPGICDPGTWSLIGGNRQGGESAEQAIRRELAEEAGLSISGLELFTVERCTGPDGGTKGRIKVFRGLWSGDAAALPLTEGVMLHWFASSVVPRLRMSDWAQRAVQKDRETTSW
ncbi:NUDIX domain-containing protein [Actinocorallia populi]|uniref:NUDIX domain-containing protein n=1 Tax=Actinocorallia populi TaxID=2079200 RepID=UPI000D08CBA8|nr:NUDIX domain-containing protein [Actinocorallia populi]